MRGLQKKFYKLILTNGKNSIHFTFLFSCLKSTYRDIYSNKALVVECIVPFIEVMWNVYYTTIVFVFMLLLIPN